MFLPKITDSDTDTETSTEISKPSPYAWKKLQKSCKKVLDNINTHINAPTYTNLNPSLNISKCDERITGQENGNRPLTHPGLEEGVGYGYDVCTSRRYECRANRVKDLDRNRLIRTRSQESIVEVLFDVNSSSPCALPTSISNPTSTLPYDQNQNQNQNHKQEQEQEQKQEQYHSNKESTHKLKSPMLISRPLDSLGDVQGYTPSSTLKSMLSNTPKKEDERTRRVRISKEVEGLVNVCFHEAREIRGREGVDGQEVVNKYEVNRLEEINTEMSREVLVNNFAYMEMRPKGRVCVESCNEFVSGSVGMVDQREEEGRGGGDDDCGSRYARSELDFEDSTYGGEDEYGDRSGGEAMGYETERSVFARLEKTEMDTNPNSNASITTTTNQPPNNINSLQPTSSIPYLPPLPHPPQINHPSPSSPTTPPSPISQALIHIPRPATPTLNQSPSHISLSLSLTSSIMDSAYLRSSEIQDHLLGYSIESLGYSFPSPDDTTFASGHETEGDIPRVEWGIEVGVDRSGEEDIDGILNYTNYDAEGRRRGRGRGVGEEKGKPQGSRIERENEDESTEEQEPAIQFRLSPCTFPGTGLYLYEPISTPKHTSDPSIIAKPPQDQTEYSAASECRSQSQVQSPHSNVKHDIIATNNHNAQYESRIEKPSLSRSDWASPDVQEHEGDVFLGKEKESRGIMMHFSRSPTGLEGVDGRDVLGARWLGR